MKTAVDIQYVNRIQVDMVNELKGPNGRPFYTRTLRFRDQDGNTVEVTAFSDSREGLEIEDA